MPIMVKATMAASRIFAVFPKRISNNSGMDVILYFMPSLEMRPEIPEKMNMPSKYGTAVKIALVPLE